MQRSVSRVHRAHLDPLVLLVSVLLLLLLLLLLFELLQVPLCLIKSGTIVVKIAIIYTYCQLHQLTNIQYNSTFTNAVCVRLDQ